MEKLEISYTTDENVKKFLKKVKHRDVISPRNSTPKYRLKRNENTCSHKKFT